MKHLFCYALCAVLLFALGLPALAADEAAPPPELTDAPLPLPEEPVLPAEENEASPPEPLESLPASVPEEAPVITAEPAPDQTPVVTAEPTPEETPVETAEPTPEEPPVITAEPTPEETPVETAEPTPEPEPTEAPPEEILPVLDGVAAVSNDFPFQDVASGAWYNEAVRYAYFHQLMNGVSGSAFQPNGDMTRGMVVTVLWRLAGSPAPAAASSFTDLTQTWYRDAVAWAQETGVTTGVTATAFQPDARITREQMTAFLARFAANVRGVSTAAGNGLATFPDRDKVSEYARAPMAWAIDLGLINGVKTDGTVLLSPRSSATRAQVAAILMRFCQKLPEAGDANSLAYLVSHTAVAGTTNQIVAVIDHNLTLWERSGGVWTKTMDVYAGYGANGLSADRTEGDMTTPIGAFPLLYAFGRDADPGTALEYRQITPTSYFSAAPDSTYNTWVESGTPLEGERLMDYANLQYRYAVVIGFNMDPVVIGRGSAIFLHCKGATWNTGGCVSVTQNDMLTLLDRLNRGAWIIIVKNAADLQNY